ncbi:hypothetical protein [Bradyrhizobium elkanii]|uniref:hypothetical protein n=1 Tax=Bradyrhizobium elkanii TaxID=29448 RepID=UPI00114CD668|nr:hypothetical protein [Bradyrhizobium elkanii]
MSAADKLQHDASANAAAPQPKEKDMNPKPRQVLQRAAARGPAKSMSLGEIWLAWPNTPHDVIAERSER